MMPLRLIGALYGLFLAGCATQGDRDSARDAYGDCVARAVARLDDGRTDPVSMAVGIAPACAVEYQRLSELMIRSQVTDNSQVDMRRQMRDGEIRLVTAAIIARRAAARR